ncbi:MAG: hypothetical protein CO042_03125 [Parcubacteria group bacterium CG_4_9_14_0_2_um_filter_41_8]|nr:MAG: hypothetical protein CO042_03125 [Parcubacteria group bacterium CG_4_9_14_0_2_um_filter_41_8]
MLVVKDDKGNQSRWQMILKEDPPGNGSVRANMLFPDEIRDVVDAFTQMIERIKDFGVHDVNARDFGAEFWVKKPEALSKLNGNKDDPVLRLSNGLIGFASASFVQAKFVVVEKE